MTNLDPRIHAFDPQGRRADVALKGQLEGSDWSWVTPQPAFAPAHRISLRAETRADAEQVTEALPGEALHILWREGDWLRVRTVHDGYLGWAAQADVLPGEFPADLTVTALRAHAFAGPKVSRAICAELCLGARLQRAEGDVVEENHRRWVPVLLPGGADAWVQEVCFAPLGENTVTELARRFLDTPYVWGGRSAWGLDCSGFTQLLFQAFGVQLPRDASQQQDVLPEVTDVKGGDLAFFPGHVGLMLDEKRMIHANATGMRVTVETLGEGEYGQRLQESLLGFRRAL